MKSHCSEFVTALIRRSKGSLTNESVGQALGRDHTTVMYAQRKILSEMAQRREVFSG